MTKFDNLGSKKPLKSVRDFVKLQKAKMVGTEKCTKFAQGQVVKFGRVRFLVKLLVFTGGAKL